MKHLIFCGMLLLLLSSCKEKLDPASFTNTKWELTSLPGLNLPTTAKATLNFADSLKISGKSFCNNYGGQGEIADNKITVKNVFGTKMFCQETDAAERAYLHALNQVNGAKITGNKLHLLDGDKTLLVFTKTN
ncbi:META domain-containing protein [Pedobacter sp. ISL-68]|uniref:META domain-containing protein n=1 Tax=unclassified Pedobacter TaxID=2628915 RepID=UPI001BEB01B6|nr:MULTISPECIES: META domain-containing protein [unclassified Pedobacter]MBT2564862.1 META domain-containing protein [Pedobacter sp. ISL-64]MBT2593419.1 META domain-containing protein [Pedobacter sp. ISL-68]